MRNEKENADNWELYKNKNKLKGQRMWIEAVNRGIEE